MVARLALVVLLLCVSSIGAQSEEVSVAHWDPQQREVPLSAELAVLDAPVIFGQRVNVLLTVTNLSSGALRIPTVEYSDGHCILWELEPPFGDVDPIPSDAPEQFFGGVEDTVVLAPGASISSRIQAPSLHKVGQWVVHMQLYVPIDSEFDDMLGGRVPTVSIEIDVKDEA